MVYTLSIMNVFKLGRIFILLIILAGVYYYINHQSNVARSWVHPLQVVIYPIAGDNNPATLNYISRLNVQTFDPIVDFLQSQAAHYNIFVSPILQIKLGSRINDIPPLLNPNTTSFLRTVWWSLKLRYWTWQHSPDSNGANINMYLIYYTAQGTPVLDTSLASAKNLTALVKVFADDGQAAQNNIVITHELLHILGATDKYNMETFLPLYPDGYADPNQRPITPQTNTEIMAGRMLVSDNQAVMPASLTQCMVGPRTAREINWTYT